MPTKEIVAWVAKVVGRQLEASEAVYLLEKATGRLQYDLQGIPARFWTTAVETASFGRE